MKKLDRRSDCGRSGRYKGVRQPQCAGGDGCWRCWAKFMLKHPDYGSLE